MTKYANGFKKIHQFRDEDRAEKPLYDPAEFDLKKLNGSWTNRIVSGLAQWALRSFGLRLMQRFFPVVRVPVIGVYFVTRFEDVMTVLKSPGLFNVPFGPEMEQMTTPPVFALGDDGAFHNDQMDLILPVWKSLNPARDIRPFVEKVTRARLLDAAGEIDAAGGLFMPVMAESAFEVFGLEPRNPDDFSAYLAACSTLIFADFAGTRRIWDQAMTGAQAVCAVLDQSINAYADLSSDARDGFSDKKIVHKLIDAVADADGTQEFSAEQRAKVRTMLFGILTGYVPTAALGAGKILDYLRKNPRRFAEARDLALAAEKAPAEEAAAPRTKLLQYLREVGRFNPSLFPGQWRLRNPDVDAPDLPRQLRRIPQGATVMVSSAAALHDPRKMQNPRRFSPEEGFLDRNGETVPDLTFGFGTHHCFGEAAAHAMLVGMFQVLLSRPEIAFVNEPSKFFGPYPGRLRMRFEVDEGHRTQQMLNAVLPLAAEYDNEKLNRELAYMQLPADPLNPNATPLKAALDASHIVHFASFNAIHLNDLSAPDAPPTHLLVELNADGTRRSVLARLRGYAGEELDRLLPFLDTNDEGDFVTFLGKNLLDFQTRPWGTTGLNFPGTEDLSVLQIKQEKELFEWAQTYVFEKTDPLRFKKSSAYLNPVSLLREIRWALRASKPELAHLLHRPKERFPAFSRHDPHSFNQFIIRYFLQYRTYAGLAIIGALIAFLSALFLACFGLLQATGLFISLWFVPLLLFITFAATAIFFLRRAELREEPDKRFASHAHISRILEMENLPGHLQNHITSVSDMKPGLLRRITLALALYIVGQMKKIWFRPGFVTDFATIHYARWFRPKGTNKLIFQSNYDGSWESYLEDFITKVHGGQTMAWNNAEGFPRTNWFFLDGARDGDAFKRWVRRQQIVTQFWYCAYPDLTTGMIRTNALVRDGLARAFDFDEARAWMALLGSRPRPDTSIETEQVQTLLFHGLGRHPFLSAFFLEFSDAQMARAWLGDMLKDSYNAEEAGIGPNGALAFGDSYPNFAPSFLGLSATGLEMLGFPKDGPHGVTTLPTAFFEGMSQRGRILGDAGTEADADLWRWKDRNDSGQTAHAVLLCYGRRRAEIKQLDRAIERRFELFGISRIQKISCELERRSDKTSDPFGIRDGIAQPVMRGTQAFAENKGATDDIVGPGEFILGYPDSRGQKPLNITVPGGHPAAALLPTTQPVVHDMIPQFGRENIGSLRDFGRNGSFLVIRQMQHNESGFDKFVDAQARRLVSASDGGGAEISGLAMTNGGAAVDTKYFHSGSIKDLYSTETASEPFFGTQIWARQWVAAKMIGRWADGSSLIRNPTVSLTVRNRARYHARVRARLKQRIEPQAGEWNFSTKQVAKMQTFLNRMDPIAGEKEDGYKLHQDRCIWTDEDWQRFTRELKTLERATAPLKLPERLLKPIVPDNDFRHGRDDPKGLYCPIGSHIRRTNPRDSFSPDNPLTLEINNRHRLLRRGRTYSLVREEADMSDPALWLKTDDVYGTCKPLEEGTLFMCFNANIERQFEFVQQTWVESRSFHDGRNAPDPLIAQKKAGDQFVIPRSADAVTFNLHSDGNEEDGNRPQNFTRTVAGGYFFVPSRQALVYLSEISTNPQKD